jgi:hypothetical protein
VAARPAEASQEAANQGAVSPAEASREADDLPRPNFSPDWRETGQFLNGKLPHAPQCAGVASSRYRAWKARCA